MNHVSTYLPWSPWYQIFVVIKSLFPITISIVKSECKLVNETWTDGHQSLRQRCVLIREFNFTDTGMMTIIILPCMAYLCGIWFWGSKFGLSEQMRTFSWNPLILYPKLNFNFYLSERNFAKFVWILIKSNRIYKL